MKLYVIDNQIPALNYKRGFDIKNKEKDLLSKEKLQVNFISRFTLSNI